MLGEAQAHIYILANGKVLEAFAADRKDNIPVEARDHISMFHHVDFDRCHAAKSMIHCGISVRGRRSGESEE